MIAFQVLCEVLGTYNLYRIMLTLSGGGYFLPCVTGHLLLCVRFSYWQASCLYGMYTGTVMQGASMLWLSRHLVIFFSWTNDLLGFQASISRWGCLFGVQRSDPLDATLGHPCACAWHFIRDSQVLSSPSNADSQILTRPRWAPCVSSSLACQWSRFSKGRPCSKCLTNIPSKTTVMANTLEY